MADIFSILTLDLDKNSNLTMTDVYQDIANITMANPSIAGATYEIGMSITSTFDSTTTSKFLRFSVDGGVNWNEFKSEAKDVTDAVPFVYIFPFTFPTEAAQNLTVQAKKETTAGIMIVTFADAWIKRLN